MNALLRKSVIVLLAMGLAGALYSQQVALYSEANSASEEIHRIDLGSPQLKEVVAVASSKGGESGWYRGKVNDTFVGYVSSSALGKDGRVKKGGVVYTRPESNAAVITFVEDGDRFQLIKEHFDGWSRVRFTKEVTVFFRKDSVLPPPAVQAESVPVASEIAPAVSTVSSVEVVEYGITAEPDVIEETSVAVEQLPPPPPSPAREVAPVAPAPQVEQGMEINKGTPVNNEKLADELPRHFEGFFKANRGFFTRNKEYQFRLEAPGGDTLSYVNTNLLILTRPIEDFMDKPVIIYGNIEKHKNGRDLVIKARGIRLKQ